MKKIKEENIVVGDFIYVIDKKAGERRYILKILSKRVTPKNIYFWRIIDRDMSNKTSFFDTITYKNYDKMWKKDWEWYNLYKLNKKERGKFNRLLILDGLK